MSAGGISERDRGEEEDRTFVCIFDGLSLGSLAFGGTDSSTTSAPCFLGRVAVTHQLAGTMTMLVAMASTTGWKDKSSAKRIGSNKIGRRREEKNGCLAEIGIAAKAEKEAEQIDGK